MQNPGIAKDLVLLDLKVTNRVIDTHEGHFGYSFSLDSFAIQKTRKPNAL